MQLPLGEDHYPRPESSLHIDLLALLADRAFTVYLIVVTVYLIVVTVCLIVVTV